MNFTMMHGSTNIKLILLIFGVYFITLSVTNVIDL